MKAIDLFCMQEAMRHDLNKIDRNIVRKEQKSKKKALQFAEKYDKKYESTEPTQTKEEPCE